MPEPYTTGMSDAGDFSGWERWSNRRSLPQLSLPGVYAIAVSTRDLSGTPFSWLEDVAYIGMTNSRGGLRARLRQFDQTIRGRETHGGALRLRFRHSDPLILEPLLFVAVRPFRCDVRSDLPTDLRVMGQVAAFEYECFARFVELHGHLPEFNDKPRSPKQAS